MKYWEHLIVKQQERGKQGLTIPFIIGSQEYLSNQHIKHDIREFVLDIVASSQYKITLRLCMDLNTFILEKSKSQNNIYNPSHDGNPQLTLSIAMFHREEFGDTIEELITKLVGNFQEIINQGLYSATKGERKPTWNKFSQNDDIPFILDAFKPLL